MRECEEEEKEGENGVCLKKMLLLQLSIMMLIYTFPLFSLSFFSLSVRTLPIPLLFSA